MSRATRAASRLVPEIPMLRRSSNTKKQPATAAAEEEVAVPAHFVCPISLDLMRDPVTAPTGITYDRDSVEAWLARGNARCPVTGRPLRLADLVPNHSTHRMIQEWCRAAGVERVATPKAPLADADAGDAVAAVSRAAARGDVAACGAAAARARALGKESDRNRRSLAGAGAGRALAAAFARLAGERVESAGVVVSAALGEILAAMTGFFPLDGEARRCIASPASLKSLVSVMSHGGAEIAARASAAVVLRELASSSADRSTLEAMSRTPGMCEALVELVLSPVSTPATKAALVTAYYLAAALERAAARLAEAGAVPAILELLVDADKGMSEKSLAALDAVLGSASGVVAARGHALAVPVLVKKMFRVSDMATEFAVSALWRLCRAGGEGARGEALRVGAFQKLLLLLQVGCGGVTKERASELLKMLNGSRDSVECIETVDFKGLKRPF
ncbi:hypothetical protein HU200_067723 [Digitaria exilis]|uniref:U-box domain-containing protein n=1 Tax=Digitaria exilis TaxID=1010633 RepID=A0A834ZV66_9POAL|nr:hypothetical protein HU200_067723 [Digitaria exilis]CAB3470189.1 unnamed protein product [Digitaria exilis]